MAETLKKLGQISPSAQTLSTLYAVPASTQASVSSIVVCNRGASATRFRISHAVAAAADADAQYLYYDEIIPANKTFVATIGITMAATDVLRVMSGNGQTSFAAYGAEVT